jgi:hypothetical protein
VLQKGKIYADNSSNEKQSKNIFVLDSHGVSYNLLTVQASTFKCKIFRARLNYYRLEVKSMIDVISQEARLHAFPRLMFSCSVT